MKSMERRKIKLAKARVFRALRRFAKRQGRDGEQLVRIVRAEFKKEGARWSAKS